MSSQQPFNHIVGAGALANAPAAPAAAAAAANINHNGALNRINNVFAPHEGVVSPPGSTTGSLHNPRTSNDRNLGLGEVSISLSFLECVLLHFFL